MPHGRVKDPWIGLVQRDVDGAGGVVDEQRLRPRLAAVDGPVDATRPVRTEGVTDRGDVRDVGVGRMDADRADLLRVVEAEVGPGVAAVGGAVDAVAVGEVLAQS